MELVVDTNVLLAALLKKAVSRELLLDARLRLFAPEHLIHEIQKLLKVSSGLRKRIKLTPKELENLFFILTDPIETVSKKYFVSQMLEALTIAPHKEDAPYLALALHLKIPIWSNDQGIQDQSKVRVYTTKELLSTLGKHG